MKKFFSFTLVLLLLAALALPLFSSCGEESGEAITLYVYNWGEYISDGSEGSLDTNAAFEEWYEETFGQKVVVNYSTYASNEDMYAKLSSGAVSYDIVVPSEYMIARMIDEDMLRPLNYDNIPNIGNIDYDVIFRGEKPFYDPEKAYSVPYTYGTVGIIYNTTMVEEEDIGSWDLMWNEKYEGNILQFNNSRDGFATALFKLGYSVNTVDYAQWDEALELMKEQKEIVQGYVMDEIFNKMENGSAAISSYYAGDFFTMYEDNEDLAFYYPKEGTNVFVDAMCIPKTAQHPEIAERYIDFMLQKEAAVANAEYMCYASPNKLVVEDEEYIAYMEDIHPDAISILYDTDDIKLEFYKNLDADHLSYLNDCWEDLKIESSINVTIVVMAAIVVAFLVGLLIFFIIRKQYRKRFVADLWNEQIPAKTEAAASKQ